jgi:hypothetical protein
VTIHLIKLADYTKFPSVRYKADGPSSGEQFRDDHIVPALNLHYQIIIDLNGVPGYPTSWIEEAFGGLVRVNKFKVNDLRARLLLDITDRLQEAEIWLHIEGADGDVSK